MRRTSVRLTGGLLTMPERGSEYVTLTGTCSLASRLSQLLRRSLILELDKLPKQASS